MREPPRVWCPVLLVAAATTCVSSDTAFEVELPEQLLFAGTGSSSAHQNTWSGWYRSAGSVESGDGKRAAYNTLPLVSVHFYDSDGAWAKYRLTGSFEGQTLLRTVQLCMGDESPRNFGGSAWDDGHCEIGVLEDSEGVPEISDVLRIGVGDGQAQALDWALFMLQTGNGEEDFGGQNAYAFGSEGATNTAHSGQVWMTGISGTSTTSSLTTSSLTTQSSTTRTTTGWVGQLLYIGDGDGDHNNRWTSWYAAGGVVEEGSGKRATYDDLPLASLHFYDDAGAWASFSLVGGYQGQTLLHIVQSCMGDSRQNDGSSPWDVGHCEIGVLDGSSGILEISNVLRLGVGDNQGQANDWALFMLQTGNAYGDFKGRNAYALGSEDATHTGHSGRVWMSGVHGTSTTSTASTSTWTTQSTMTSTATTSTTTGWVGELLYAGPGSGSHGNAWVGWYSSGTTVAQGAGKRVAYDSLPLSSLHFYDNAGVWASFALLPQYRGQTILQTVQECVAGGSRNNASAVWDQGHCEIGVLEGSAGVANVANVLRLGVGDGQGQPNDWALFMLQNGNANGDFAGYDAYALGSEGATHTGHSGLVWLSGIPGSSTTSTATTTTATTSTASSVTSTTSTTTNWLGELLYAGSGSGSHGNTWAPWYTAGSGVEQGQGKRVAYDDMPLSSLHFYDSAGAWASFSLVAEFRGETLLHIVQSCMANDPRNNGSAVWTQGHCEIGVLQGSSGVPNIAGVLRLGVGDGQGQSGDWALFMLETGNANGDFQGNNAYALGSEGATHTGHTGLVWMSGVLGSSTTSSASTSTATTQSTTTSTTSAWVGELLYAGVGTGSHNNAWAAWHSAGGTVEQGEGKRAAYDSLPLSSLHFYDSAGAWASFTLLGNFQGRTLLDIVQTCLGQHPHNSGGDAWDNGHCEIGTLEGASGVSDLSSTLRLGVGDGQGAGSDWGLFMLQTGNANGDFAGNSAYALGSEGRTHTGHGGPVWMSGVPGTSTTSAQGTHHSSASSTTTGTGAVFATTSMAPFTTQTVTRSTTPGWLGEVQSVPRLQLYQDASFLQPHVPLLSEGHRVFARQTLGVTATQAKHPVSVQLQRVWLSTSSNLDDAAAEEINLLSTVTVLSASQIQGLDISFVVPVCHHCFLHVVSTAFPQTPSSLSPYSIHASLRLHVLEDLSDPQSGQAVLSGSLDLRVDEIGSFLADPLMQEAVAATIRHLADLPAWTPVAVSLAVLGRRLRALAESMPTLRAAYSIVLPVQAALNATNALSSASSDTISQQLQNDVNDASPGSYQVSVTGHTAPVSSSSGGTGTPGTPEPGSSADTTTATSGSSPGFLSIIEDIGADIGIIAGAVLIGVVILIGVCSFLLWRRGRRKRSPVASPVAGPDSSSLSVLPKSRDSFRLRPLQSSELEWAVLENMLVPPPSTKDTMHVGRDILPYRKRYRRLVLRRAWVIDMPLQQEIYDVQKRRVQADLREIGGLSTDTLLDEASRLLGVDSSCNEKLLLHGTKAASVLGILQRSISEHLTTQAVFGGGAYCAEDPSKSNQYADPDTGERGNEEMRRLHQALYGSFGQNHPGEVFYTFACEVIVGCPVHTKGKLNTDGQLLSVAGHKHCAEGLGIFADPRTKRALVEVPGQSFRFHTLIVEKGLDSVVERHREFVVFDGKNILPRYLLAYSREE